MKIYDRSQNPFIQVQVTIFLYADSEIQIDITFDSELKQKFKQVCPFF